MTNLQKFAYLGNSIAFNFGENTKMVNATQMCKPFGKNVADFLRLKQTSEFLEILKRKNSDMGNPISLVKVIKGNYSNSIQQGTWIHYKLALRLAQWLNPEFAFWVDERIEELLTTGKTQLQPISEAEQILNVINLLNNKVEAQKRQIAEQQPKVEYCETVLESKSTYTISVIAKELGMTAIALNRFLHLNNIQYQTRKGEPWLLRKKYANLGYTDTLTFEYKDKNDNVRTKIQTRWTEKGRKFIHSLMN